MTTRRLVASLVVLHVLSGTASAEISAGRFSLKPLPASGGVECSGEIRPDRAVVVGGITAEHLRPSEARKQIERQLEEVRKFVTAQGGSLILGELVRAARTSARGQGDARAEAAPFLMLQRLEVVLPTAADVDQVLDRLLQMGLDRFGQRPSVDAVDSSARIVVRYRFSALHDALEMIHRACKTRALQQWCEATTPAAEHAGCSAVATKLAPLIGTQMLTLQSQPVLSEHSGTQPLTFTYPWQQLAAVELVGNVPLKLTGAIVVAVPAARP